MYCGFIKLIDLYIFIVYVLGGELFKEILLSTLTATAQNIFNRTPRAFLQKGFVKFLTVYLQVRNSNDFIRTSNKNSTTGLFKRKDSWFGKFRKI